MSNDEKRLLAERVRVLRDAAILRAKWRAFWELFEALKMRGADERRRTG